MRPSLLFSPALAILVGCGPVITLHHRSAPDAECNADMASGAGPGLLDLSSGRGYTAVVTASSLARVSLESVTVFVDQGGEPVAGLPSETTPRISGTGGFVTGAPTLVPLMLVTNQEAHVLDQGIVGSFLETPDDRTSINVSAIVAGGAYSSNEIVLELQLCRGCLIPACSSDRELSGVCFLGQDEGATCND